MNTLEQNFGFLYGHSLWNAFFIKDAQPVLTEASYFLLMSSMRKLRMNIPMHFTEEYFTEKVRLYANTSPHHRAGVRMMVYVEKDAEGQEVIQEYWESLSFSLFDAKEEVRLDVLKEVQINGGLLTALQTHRAEERYAEIFCRENDLSDVILLNADKKIARTGKQNILLLQNGSLRMPLSSDGTLLSVLMESFLTWVHQQGDIQIVPESISPFETQTADEVLLISDLVGCKIVSSIRNKTFPKQRLLQLLGDWWAQVS